MRYFFFFFALLSPFYIHAQILSEQGNLMGEFINYEQNLMPDEDSEAFIVPDSLQLKQWKRMMDLFVAESYTQAEDSLTTHFSNYEMVLLTDTSFVNREYYLIQEKNPPTLGWGLFVSDPDYQRDAIIALPHPLHDSFTPQEGVNLFQYLGARVLTMAGTHRCSNEEEALSDGTTTVCSVSNSSEKFKVSDMAHFDSSAFQIAHESIKELSSNVYAINVHGHADSDCEDVFLSNGRSDDPKSSLQTLRDNLISNGVDAAMTGDGSLCTLAGTTNVQGRFMNGSTNPADDQPVSNTGYFFHMEQSQNIRRSLNGHKKVIDAFADLIPRTFNTFTIPDYPSLIFNEIHFNPASDANKNGSVGSVSDEFLEIINTGTKAINLDSWIIADNSSDRHIIPAITNLLPNQALLVFGQASFEGTFGGATVQGASTNALSLSNSGEKIFIKSPANNIITMIDYPGDVSGESITLNPDITGSTFVAHSTADTDDNSLFSPGTKINGAPFLPFVEISGDAGWRMMAIPTQKMPISDLSVFTPIQGFGDGHTKNFYSTWNGTEWIAPNSLSDSLDNAEGFILYFFDNTNSESSALPIILRGTGTITSSDVSVNLHTNGDKWNLIGNPFDKAIDFSMIILNGGTLESNVGQIYDPITQSYKTTTSIGDSVAAWQGIMIENSTASSITLPFSSVIDSANFFKTESSNSYLVLSAKDTKTEAKDQFVIYFSNHSKIEWDSNDAKELNPLSSTAISFSGIGLKEEKEIVQTQMSLPNDFNGLEKIEIPLLLKALNTGNKLQIEIEKAVNIPDNFSFIVKDTNSSESRLLSKNDPHNIILNGFEASNYKLIISSSEAVSLEEESSKPTKLRLFQNYPNPFNPKTVISYQLPEQSLVKLQIYNINGALVSTLINEFQPSGEYTLRFDGGSLSSGIYFYKISTSFGTISKKMILLK